MGWRTVHTSCLNNVVTVYNARPLRTLLPEAHNCKRKTVSELYLVETQMKLVMRACCACHGTIRSGALHYCADFMTGGMFLKAQH